MDNLKKKRNENHVSQQKLANHLGVSRSTVAMWETGGSEPSNEMLAQIASFFGTSVDYLLGLDDNEQKKETPTEADVTFDDFTYALHNESKELSEEKKQQLLEMARFLRQQQNKEKGK